MAQKFKEVAHLRTDLNKYGEGYDRIFKKESCEKTDADSIGESDTDKENKRIKELARQEYILLGSGQDTEGFPESGSFIYGYYKGYQAAREGK